MFDFSMIVIIFVYIIMGLFVFFFLNKKIDYKNKPCFNGIRFAMILYYIIIPIILYLFINKFILYEKECGIWCSDSINRLVLNKNIWEILYSFLCIFITFIVFYNSYKKNRTIWNIKEEYDEKKHIKLISFFNIITFVIGTISLILLIISFDGIQNMLSNAEKYRSFSYSLTDDIGKIGVLVIPARLITVTPILSFLLLKKDKTNKKIYFTTLFISGLLSIIFYLYNAGRAPILLFLLSILYVILKKFFKRPWHIIIILSFFCLPLLDIADSLFVSFSNGGHLKISFNYIKYLYQFIYPIRNVLNVHNINLKFGFRYGIDFFTSFLDLIPGLSFSPSYENTSLYINGNNWTLLGGVPNDFITFSNIQFGIIGNVLLSYILGYISAILDMKIEKFDNNICKDLLIGIMTIYSYSLISSFDFCSFIRGNFILIIISIIVIKSYKKERVK